ncbi:MAG TPA: DUF692 family protein [Planctomycetota bacterium]|nr:DUF692 family protein [Planctomycetota bacterium]
MTAIGFTLQPHLPTLELLAGLIEEEPDYYEVTPETLWRPGRDGAFEANGFHQRFLALRAHTGKPFVAHGVGFSVGSARPDSARRERWLGRMREDARAFEFGWYTEHHGVTVLDGRELILPLPVAMNDASVATVRASLACMQTCVPDVGLENSVFYFHLGEPLDEPAFFARVLDAPRTHLLLDLHNVYTTALNAGFEPWEYVQRLPLARVIEIHVSGGRDSDPRWLASGATRRLDSHDDSVPETVWHLLERVLPLCANVRGVTLERMEGTVEPDDVALVREELRRARRIAEKR